MRLELWNCIHRIPWRRRISPWRLAAAAGCALAIYFAVPLRWRNLALLLTSLVFYGWGGPIYISIMVLSILIDYTHGLLVEKYRSRDKLARWFVAESVLLNLGLLGFFKYWDFFAANLSLIPGVSIPTLGLPLPIGISFFTFQTMSYTIDVYRGEAKAQKNIINFGAYVTLFPQLIAGPIVRYADVAPQLRSRTHTVQDAALGARRFVLGLGKKVLLANVLYELVTVYQQSGQKTVLLTWLYAAAYMLHVYFDFSGYSDMAIGLGRIMGFRFAENFRYPFVSGSLTEFWRRWHISLGSWFRDYVYIPLGGSRVGKARWVRNLVIVWGLTGLWHGAAWNFVAWGLYFAAFLLLEKLFLGRWLKRVPALGHVYVLLAALFSFVLFDAASVPAALGTAGGLLGLGGLPLWDSGALYYLRSYAPVLALAAVGSTPLPAALCRRIAAGRAGRVLDALEPIALLALLAVCTAFLVSGSANPFLYFRF